ncbi:type II toxin-antitoxin system RelE/ParE family toxin [Oricola sp.]|uniref:type II toxin-antitoxin system RelE/ParE family toxin n=1 Tax=Oricola sp. TaxID=1979950 RepID=UPI003BA97E12
MNRVTFSPAAIADIEGIWDYTAESWGADQADRYTDDIRDACHDLATGRKQGRTVGIRDSYLKYAVGRHFVFFVPTGDGIAVIRVLHQRMDTERHL